MQCIFANTYCSFILDTFYTKYPLVKAQCEFHSFAKRLYCLDIHSGSIRISSSVFGVIDPLNLLLKNMPGPWLTGSNQVWIVSFKWGSKHSFCQGAALSKFEVKVSVESGQFGNLFLTLTYDIFETPEPKWIILKFQFISIHSQRANDVTWLLLVISVGERTPRTQHKM